MRAEKHACVRGELGGGRDRWRLCAPRTSAYGLGGERVAAAARMASDASNADQARCRRGRHRRQKRASSNALRVTTAAKVEAGALAPVW